MARPTKFNIEIAEQIVDALREGHTRKASAEAVRLRYQTLLNWLKRGERATKGELFEFFVSVRAAEAEAEKKYAAVIQKAADGHETVTITRTQKTVIRTKKTKHPDGTIIEEPVALEDVTEQVVTSFVYDWRAGLEWLKRRRHQEWGDRKRIDVKELDDAQIVRLLEGEARGGSEEEGPSDPEDPE